MCKKFSVAKSLTWNAGVFDGNLWFLIKIPALSFEILSTAKIC